MFHLYYLNQSIIQVFIIFEASLSMQVEKHLFKIAQKSNKSENAEMCWGIIHVASLILAVTCLAVFAVGELYVKNNLHQLENCFVSNNFILEADQVGLVYSQHVAPLNKLIANTTPLKNSSYCQIYKNLNGTQITDDSQLTITGLYSIYRMQKRQKQLLKIDNYTLVLSNRSILKQFIYTASILFSNQLISLAQNKQLQKITKSKQIFVKNPAVRFSFQSQRQATDNIFTRFMGIVTIVFTYAVASVITSLYIYVTIIASPAVILVFLQMTPYGRTEGFFQAFKAFPWIGMHSLIYRGSSNLVVRRRYIDICPSLIAYFCIMYMGYYTIVVQISNLFFDQPMQAGVGEILFGYFAIIQFAGLVFMRTRPFMKYFPVINTLFVFFFMLYCKFTPLGFKLPAVVGMQFLGIALFSWMVLKLQIPAQKTWVPANEYVPNIKQPRAGLLPTFNLNWINALPDQWTMLIPLVGRENFTPKELAFIQQDYQGLGEYLNQR